MVLLIMAGCEAKSSVNLHSQYTANSEVNQIVVVFFAKIGKIIEFDKINYTINETSFDYKIKGKYIVNGGNKIFEITDNSLIDPASGTEYMAEPDKYNPNVLDNFTFISEKFIMHYTAGDANVRLCYDFSDFYKNNVGFKYGSFGQIYYIAALRTSGKTEFGYQGAQADMDYRVLNKILEVNKSNVFSLTKYRILSNDILVFLGEIEEGNPKFLMRFKEGHKALDSSAERLCK